VVQISLGAKREEQVTDYILCQKRYNRIGHVAFRKKAGHGETLRASNGFLARKRRAVRKRHFQQNRIAGSVTGGLARAPNLPGRIARMLRILNGERTTVRVYRHPEKDNCPAPHSQFRETDGYSRIRGSIRSSDWY